MARASTTSDVFNAVADVHRREILDVLVGGERAVGIDRRRRRADPTPGLQAPTGAQRGGPGHEPGGREAPAVPPRRRPPAPDARLDGQVRAVHERADGPDGRLPRRTQRKGATHHIPTATARRSPSIRATSRS